jgi:hypothetical protein
MLYGDLKTELETNVFLILVAQQRFEAGFLSFGLAEDMRADE